MPEVADEQAERADGDSALPDEGVALADGEAALADESFEPTIISSTVGFAGRVWNVLHDEFEYNGHPLVREYVEHPGAVAILARNDADEVLLIQQYRHPIRSRDWEIPAGLLDVDGEAPLAAAKRELEEEVDLVASSWTELGAFFSSPGGSSELIRVFEARGLTASRVLFNRTEEEADIVRRWVPLVEALTAVLDGRLRNSILAYAVLAANARA